MLRNLHLLVVFMLLIGPAAKAESVKSFSKQMNEIKRSGDYVYAESSAPNEIDAKAACDALLKIEITKYLVADEDGNNANATIVKDISSYNREYLVQPRGDMFRVFGYVAKNGIAGAKNKKQTPLLHAQPDMAPSVSDLDTVHEATPPARFLHAEEVEIPEAAPSELHEENEECIDMLIETQSLQSEGRIELKTDNLELLKWQKYVLESVVSEPSMSQAKKLLNRYKNQNRIKRLGDNSVNNPRANDSFYLIFDNSGKPVMLLAPSATRSYFDMISGSWVGEEALSQGLHLWFQLSK